MKELNFTIPCPNGVCLSTKRMSSLKGKLPTKDVLFEHMKLERRLVDTVEGYSPKPFSVSVTKWEMNQIITEIKSKSRYELGHVFLLLKSNNLPIAVISELIEEEETK